MENKEVLQFFLKKGLLVDNEVLNLFSEENDFESIKLIIEKIQTHIKKKVITKDLFKEHKSEVGKAFYSLPRENQKKLERLKIKLGLSIEITREDVGREDSAIEKGTNNVKVTSVNCEVGHKFLLKDFVNYYRSRYVDMKGFLASNPVLENLVSINKISGSRQGISIIGLILNKSVTKNKNIIFEVEDLTGKIKILVNKDKEDLYKKAEEVALDSVIGFKCSGSNEILFANDLVYPETKLFERKRSSFDESVAFIGDIHYGSKKFMAKNFDRFVDYLNGNSGNWDESSKIKYLVIVGDIITGVGNYPNQIKDLEVVDLEDQYTGFAELLGRIRKDIKIIICPGNHEGVRLMEPQPIFDEKYAWALHDMENVILVENPATINIGSSKDFSGFNILMYHGFSYFYYINNVPRLMKMKAANYPEKVMEYLLKHRHLAPARGSVQFFPSSHDSHIIREIPDIFFSGHTHKGAVVYYNNILVLSSSTWEEMTPYQEKFGNQPDHCKVPVFNLKSRSIKILDFE